MFTVLWKIPDGAEEIYSVPCVVKKAAVAGNPTAEERAKMDCNGDEHISFHKFDGFATHKQVINLGDVYVMNADGKTVATYLF